LFFHTTTIIIIIISGRFEVAAVRKHISTWMLFGCFEMATQSAKL